VLSRPFAAACPGRAAGRVVIVQITCKIIFKTFVHGKPSSL